MTTLTPTGSLTAVMDELVALEESISSDLIVYRWKPVEVPQLDQGGVIYDWVNPSPFEVYDISHWRDNLRVTATVAIRHSDLNQDMERIEGYVDTFRDVIDDELYKRQPLGGTCKVGRRIDMRMAEDVFNGIPVLAIQFPMEFELLRLIAARQ